MIREEIERTASEMERKYGKVLAIVECQNKADEYLDKINHLPHYDPEKIDAWDKLIHFWLSVKSSIELITV
jgi:hypothetical protein